MLAENSQRKPGRKSGAPAESPKNNTSLTKVIEELHESDALWRSIAETPHDFVVIVDRDGVFHYVNRTLPEIKKEDLIGVARAHDFSAPEHLERIDTALKLAFEDGLPSSYEVYCPPIKRWFFSVVGPVRKEGEVIAASILSLDISERKHAEEALSQRRALLEDLVRSSRDGILAFDRECRYTVWNPGMERISGFGEADTLGKCAFDVFPFLRDIGEDRFFYAALAGETIVAHDRAYIIPGTGKQGYFEGHYSPLRDPSGEIVGGLAVIQDITERKAAEEKLKTALQEKETLLSEVHHRVKNNLQVVSSILYLESQRATEEPMRRTLEDIKERVSAMALVHETLYRSKNFSHIRVSDYLDELIRNVSTAHRSGAGDIRIVKDLSDWPIGIEHTVPLGLLVVELVGNAFKHAFPEGRSGEISVACKSSDGKTFHLCVKDDGVGFPQDFDPQATGKLGMKLIRALSGQLGAEVEWDTSDAVEARLLFTIE